MDCHEVQTHLELRTLGSASVDTPEVLQARKHLQDCDACHLTFESMRRFDRQVSDAMTNTPLPEGLVGRLQATVQEAAGVSPERNVASRSRRIWRRATATACVVAVLLLMLAWIVPRDATMGSADVDRVAGLELNLLPAVSAGTLYSLPSGWKSLRGVQLSESPRLIEERDSNVLVLPMIVRADRRSPPVSGLLMILPESRWQSRVTAESFSVAPIQYAAFGAWVVWREGNVVFVCALRGDARGMERFQDFVAGSRELT